MTRLNLRDWVLLITLVPTIIIGLALGGYFTLSRYMEVEQMMLEKGINIVEPIAMSAGGYLAQQQRQQLEDILQRAHTRHSPAVKSIAVFTQDNQLFVTTNSRSFENLRLASGLTMAGQISVQDTDQALVIRSPITVGADGRVLGYVGLELNRESALLTKQDTLLDSVLIMFIAIGVSIYMIYRLMIKVSTPISTMVTAIDKIREGRLDTRISGDLLGELSLLKNGINALARSLGDYQDEMNRGIDQATSDLKQTLEEMEIQNIELDIAKRKAQEANRIKSEFLANMSHELRTPLNGVIGFTRQLLKTPLNNHQTDYLHTIEKSANNLLSIINDILDFSKLEAGRLVLENIPFSMRECIEEAVTLMAPMAHDKNLELSVHFAGGMSDSLIGDPNRLKQILINLIGNAIKFTSQGSVCVDISELDSDGHRTELKVAVTDTGIGISEAQRKTLFEAFGQADSSVTRRYGGTGLGLVIAKRLSNAMNGELHVTSEPNQGSTFWFTFVADISEINVAPLFAPAALAGKTVLLVESHTHTRMALADVLRQWQMDVSEVAESRDLTRLDKQFDLAIYGTQVSPGDIAQVKERCSKLKQMANNLHLLINNSSPNLREALIGAGATSCQTKPIPAEKLALTIASQYQDMTTVAQNAPHYEKHDVKVLAVDDNDANLKLITAFLTEQVTEVKTAVDGQQAVELCNQEVFDLIFMDIQMPIMDGVTACKKILAHSLNEKTPIIAVTAHALPGEKDRLLAEGFTDYLTKPLDEEMLHQAIVEYRGIEQTVAKQAHASTWSAPPAPQASNSEVIDWNLALSRAGGKTDLAEDMLKMLVDSIPQARDNISDGLAQGDREHVLKHVHKVHGASCYTGVPRLKHIAETLETALKGEQALADIEPELYELFDEMDNIITANQARQKAS